jgi:hypothetical protein
MRVRLFEAETSLPGNEYFPANIFPLGGFPDSRELPPKHPSAPPDPEEVV